MTDNCVRLGLSLAVIALISAMFFQFSSRTATAVEPVMMQRLH